MNCERFDDQAELYVVGELSPELVAEAEAHLAACPACRQRADAARRRLRALDAALAPHRASDGFVDRAMARVRAEAAPLRAEGPEPLRRRVLRYAAVAAAAALLAMAGYGLLRPGGDSWLESGTVAVLGPNARPLGPRQTLRPGDVLATPAGGSATLAFANGRLRVALAPLTTVRIADPSTGTALQLVSGEIYCAGSKAEGAPTVACPLANVAAGPGVVSLHVTPEKGAAPPANGTEPFQGTVTLASHDGTARVMALGRGPAAIPLEQGHVLALSSDRRRALVTPVGFEQLRQVVDAERRGAMARHRELEWRWDTLMGGIEGLADPDRVQVLRWADELQEAMGQMRAIQAELDHRLKLLERCQAEGRRVFRVSAAPR
jgi:hypothetical protein